MLLIVLTSPKSVNLITVNNFSLSLNFLFEWMQHALIRWFHHTRKFHFIEWFFGLILFQTWILVNTKWVLLDWFSFYSIFSWKMRFLRRFPFVWCVFLSSFTNLILSYSFVSTPWLESVSNFNSLHLFECVVLVNKWTVVGLFNVRFERIFILICIQSNCKHKILVLYEMKSPYRRWERNIGVQFHFVHSLLFVLLYSYHPHFTASRIWYVLIATILS